MFPGAVSAQVPGDTPVTFVISSGGLSITVPSSASLGTVQSGATTTSGQLGTVTVTDNRGSVNAFWPAAGRTA